MIKQQAKNELVELRFSVFGMLTEASVVTFQLRLYCTSSGHRYMAGETEFIAAADSATFRKPIRLDYLPECQQTIEILLTSSDNPAVECLGRGDLDLGVLIDEDETLTLPLLSKDQKAVGQVLVGHKPIVDDRSSFHVGINCLNVKNLEFFSTSDPFLVLFRPADSHITALSKDDIPPKAWIALHQTEYQRRDLNPKFRPFGISKWNLCRGNLDAILKLELWDHSSLGRHKKISTGFTTVNRISTGADRYLNTFDEKDKFGGTVCFGLFDEKKFYMFDQYILAGVQLRLVLALDCSGSTKELHFHESTGTSSVFERALGEVATVLSSKEQSHRFGLLGYGAKINACRYPTFAFNFESRRRDMSVASVESALELYRSVMPQLEPEEPTKIAPVIERLHVMMKYQDKRNFKIFTVLVILTDGGIDDLQDTVDKIVECSNFPLAIVFVGIGSGDFSDLEYLESGCPKDPQQSEGKKPKKTKKQRSTGRLKDSAGKEAYGRIVRFVYYQNYMGKTRELEESLFKEVPRQMTEFYNLMKFDPCPMEAKEDPSN